MKHLPSRIAGTGAFTLIELMVSTAAVGITGLVLYYVLFVGMTLFAKNTAINMAHQEARAAVLQMEYDIHSAVSTPELTDVNRNPVTGNGPSAGISFQLFSAGPFQVTPSSTGYAVGQNQISIRVNGYTPVAGQRLIIPGYQVELDISTVGAGSTDRILTLSANLPEAVTPTLSGQAINIPCFITDRVAYVVNGTQLYYYGRQSNNTFKVMANYITSSTPFSVPVTALGAPFNRFVAAVNLVTVDSSLSNMNYRAANMFLNAMEPYRSRLCIYQ